MNPLLPHHTYTPDVEAREYSDGRIYLYGSADIRGATTFCSHEYRVFSSADMKDWEDHGISFRSTPGASDIPWSESLLFAPDCFEHDGRYWLAFCNYDNTEGIAVSDSPAGPFGECRQVEGAHGTSIDPALLRDDDGSLYFYWGQFHLQAGQLNENLDGFVPGTQRDNLITKEEHGFEEGASVRKVGDRYVLLYTDNSRGKATSLSYALADHPLGPFEKKGVVIDNAGCDKGTWNNHGSIASFQGQWYIFYHRSSHGCQWNRRVCVEPITIAADGTIAEVEMTSQGAGGPLDALRPLEAWRYCLLSGEVQSDTAEAVGDAASYEYLTNFHDGDWAAYKYLDWSRKPSRFEAEVSSLSEGGVLELRLDAPDGECIGECTVPPTGGWQQWQTVAGELSAVDCIHALCLVCRGEIGRRFSVRTLRFA
ncbi:MAG: family 43 glycosylhydrolase [Planctomycetota bacterium]|jgi:hypothetical protein